MRIRLAALLLAASAVALATSPTRAGEVADLLVQADAVRSSEPAKFAALLDRVEHSKAPATGEERALLRLLRAYQQVAAGKYSAAISAASALYSQSSSRTIQYRAALLVANAAAISRDFAVALRYLQYGLDLASQIQDKDQRHNGYVVAGILYNQHGQYLLGKQYAEQVLSQEPMPRWRCFAQQLKAEAASGLRQPVLRATMDQWIQDCVAQREPIASNLLRGYLARQMVEEGDARGAVTLLESSLPEVEATRYPGLISEIHGLLAQYRSTLGDHAGAERDARAALASGGVTAAYSQPVVTAHRVLYEEATRRGDFQHALSEYRAYAEADKARLDEIKAREIAFQMSRNELQQKNLDIALLSKQNEVLRLQQQVEKASSQNGRLLIALLALLLAGGALWAVRARRTQRSLRSLAETDGLTGISNRRHFRNHAEAAFLQCEQRGLPVAILLFDLDHFKQINDRHGHATGDRVLQEVARCVGAQCRKGDLFGRMGGEEFALALLDCDLQGAHDVAEALRACIESIDCVAADEMLRVTASFGCAGSALSGHAYEALCAHADVALYRAKHAGRNRISVHDGRAVSDAAPASATEGADCAPCEALHQSAEA